MDELIGEVEKLKVEILINKTKLDIILYADDVLLVSTSVADLMKQLEIVGNYGCKYGIKYNPDKSLYMVFNENYYSKKKKKKTKITLDNQIIKQVSKMKYLGMEISSDNKNKSQLESRRSIAIAASMKLKSLGLFTNQIHANMKAQLYKTYIRPILLYGTKTPTLSNQELIYLKRTEGTIIKNILNVSSRCKTSILLYVLNIFPKRETIDLNKINFNYRLNGTHILIV